MNRFKYYVKRVFDTFKQMEMRILPGNIAFFFVMALIPMVTIIIFLSSRFGVSMDSIISFVKSVVPGEAGEVIVSVISGKGFDGSVGTFQFIALVAASNGTYAIINASNTLYQVTDRDVLKDRIKSVILLFILLGLIIFLILVPMFGEKILGLFHSYKLIARVRWFYHLLNWPLTVFFVYMNLKVIYTIAPSKRIPSRSTTKGAIFTTIIWTVATAVFSSYLKYFANYNVVYGNLSNIIILMMWLYIISYVFVMGIAINVTNINQ